jgi:DNA-binding NtrC family response regulator
MSYGSANHNNRQYFERKTLPASRAKSSPKSFVASKSELGSPVPHVLIVEDDEASGAQLEAVYLHNNYTVSVVRRAEDALLKLAGLNVDLCVTDLRLPGMSGVDWVKHIRAHHPDVPVIVITGYGDIEIATDVLKLGVRDFFTKPFSLAAMKESTESILQEVQLVTEIRHLRRSLKEFYNFGGMISKTPAMHELFETIRSVSDTDLTVTVEGETGTGKELVARAIHSLSNRRLKPFIAINCAGVMESLLESELFGYERGAFTGAEFARPGKLELANGGTLFLDEIASMSLNMQSKLLRVLEERQLYRLGATRPVQVDMRVIAASNVRLQDLLAEKKMREDFFYRIHVIPIELIPLRQRREDIPLLVQNFLHHHPVAVKKCINRISELPLSRLMAHSWPGNIRELQNVLERAIVREKSRVLTEVDVPYQREVLQLQDGRVNRHGPLRQWLREQEKQYLIEKLALHGGQLEETARSCHVGLRTLFRKMRRHGLDRLQFQQRASDVVRLAPPGEKSDA